MNYLTEFDMYRDTVSIINSVYVLGKDLFLKVDMRR